MKLQNTQRLPFKVAPKSRKVETIGNEEIGILELERRNCLLVEEAIVFEQVAKRQRESTLKLYRLAEKISQDLDVSLLEALDLIRQGDIAGNETLLRYLPELTALSDGDSTFSLDKAEVVTATIRCRLGQPDWSLEDTKAMDEPLIDGLFEFVTNEKTGWETPEVDPAEEEAEADAGKLSAA